jgi:hypothetical protein
MDQEIRNKLRNVVTRCRKLLEDSVSQELEGKYGIFVKKDQVIADPSATMTHLTEEEQAARRDILNHFDHIIARGFRPKEALDQLVREIAFTHLNRLCAYKMMEAREVYIGGQKFREAVSRGINSNGVKFYLADNPEEERLFNTGHQDTVYRHFLDWLGGALSDEIGVLFNPNDPANRLYPRQQTLDEVLDLLNGGGIKVDEIGLREQWTTIWSQDETIGWVYQYFTPKELRDQVRSEGRLPGNSYELAFLNQFFTPRYVVEFLSDNTLGRIWYEMREGDTKLGSQCRYMVRRHTEIFLKEGQQRPEESAAARGHLSQAEQLKLAVYIPHRPKKDPRELKILDPACGSGHFLLYCFDLLMTIYEEAYTDPKLGSALQKDYQTVEDLKRDLPRLILAHNIHGIDIDLRCTQIAALALWLRSQRAYQEMGLKKDRPKISRTNFVCAEPMPGEKQMLKDFVDQLEPKVLGQVVEVVFDKMKLAGEAGPLLRIEEETRDAVAAAKKQWVRETTLAIDKKGHALLFTERELDRLAGKPQQPSLFDISDITDEQFFEQAEGKVIEALRSYSEKALIDQRLQRRLFTEDAVRGFAFVDLCHQRFDVILMNPPFGSCSRESEAYIASTYPASKADILAVFVERMLAMCRPDGAVGVISSRTCFFLGMLADFRETVLGHSGFIEVLADLGEGVLEAMVEVAMYVLHPEPPTADPPFFRSLLAPNKAAHIETCVSAVREGTANTCVFISPTAAFSTLPGQPYCYWVSPETLRKISALPKLEGNTGTVRVGLQTSDDFRFLRLIWEVPAALLTPSPSMPKSLENESLQQDCLKELGSGKRWAFYSKTDAARPWLSPLTLVVDWEHEGQRIKDYARQQGNSPSRSVRSEDRYFQAGLSYMLRSVRITPYIVPEGVIPTAGRAQVYPISSRIGLMGVLSSNVASAVARFRGEKFAWPKFQASIIQELPVAEMSRELQAKIEVLIESYMATSRAYFRGQEPLQEFCVPVDGGALQSPNWNLVSLLGPDIEREVATAYGLTSAQYSELERDIGDALSLGKQGDEEDPEESNQAEQISGDWLPAEQRLSYCVGGLFGRWDIRFLLDPSLLPRSQGPFDRMPVCPPGTLVSADGLPAQSGSISSSEWLRARPDATSLPKIADGVQVSLPDDQYPIRICWDGIAVEDEDNSDDIVRRVREVTEAAWRIDSDEFEKTACEAFGVNSLRGYFRKPGKGGFWFDHIRRHSVKRSRKAPVYWLLQSSKKNYSIWLFYHRLNKDILFKALIKYVEPKIRLESTRLDALNGQRASVGNSSKEGKRLAKEIEAKEEFISELHDFEAKLRRAANLHLEPDLNDGVVLNIAPLWELVPWKEAKNYWDELLKGKYEWSSIGKQLRQRQLVK